MNKARGLISTEITPPEVRWDGFDRRNFFLDLLRIEASLFLFLVLPPSQSVLFLAGLAKFHRRFL